MSLPMHTWLKLGVLQGEEAHDGPLVVMSECAGISFEACVGGCSLGRAQTPACCLQHLCETQVSAPGSGGSSLRTHLLGREHERLVLVATLEGVWCA